jgi:hypothetical protein
MAKRATVVGKDGNFIVFWCLDPNEMEKSERIGNESAMDFLCRVVFESNFEAGPSTSSFLNVH